VVAVVVSWRQVDQLGACLDALDAQRDVDLDVVVVDNASGDGSLELLRAARAAPGVTPDGGRQRHQPRVRRRCARRAGRRAPTGRCRLAGQRRLRARTRPPRHLVAVLDADPGCAAVQGRLERQVRAADGTAVIDSTGIVATRARLFRDRDEGRARRGGHGGPPARCSASPGRARCCGPPPSTTCGGVTGRS
jgi:hypothetical protein